MTTRSVMIRLRGDTSDLNRALLGAGRNVKEFSNNLETSNDRATWLAQGLTAIVPAVAPIGAQAVPAIAGLTAELGAAVLAAGTTVLAFQGVGDAMKASIQYEAEPTAANLQKLQQAMQDISPAAQEFVTQVNDLMPQIKGLRDIAAENMFPGMSEGLDSLITLLPRARDLIGSVAEANGRMASEAGASLAGPEWRSFFDYLQRNAAPTTAELGRTIGNVTKGLADLLVAFEPVEQSWSKGMLNMSRSFADWAAGVSKTQGFEDFVNYLQTSGPQVLATVGDLANMFLQVAEAAAPLGGPTLAAIRGFANAVSAIADSPLGPVIIGAVAATSALSRALAVSDLLFRKNATGATGFASKAVSGYKSQVTAIGQLPRAYREASTAQSRLSAAQLEAQAVTSRYVGQLQVNNRLASKGIPASAAAQGRLADSLGRVEMANYAVTDATSKAKAAEAGRAATLRQSAAGLGKTAAGVGALTVATTGLADGMGLSNTATLGLAGAMAGPWGAALGATVGLLKDLNDQGSGTRATLANLSQGVKDSDYSKLVDNLQKAKDIQKDVSKTTGFKDFFSDIGESGGASALRFMGKLSTDEVPAAEKALKSMGGTYIKLSAALGKPLPANASIAQIDKVAQSAAPALRELGLSAADLKAMDPAEFRAAATEIGNIMTAADSTAGRTKAFGQTVRDLDNDMLSTADSAGQMSAALNALVAPGLSAEAATDKYRATVRALSSELKASAGFTGASAGAAKNRATSGAFMGDLTDMLAKQAEAGASSTKIANEVKRARQEFIREGVAAGFSAEQMGRRADKMKLTPRLVRTVMSVVNAKAVDNITRRLRSLPRAVRTSIAANGIPRTEAGVRALQRRYNLTPRQVRTLVAMRDQTPGTQRKILANLRKLNGSKANPKAEVRDGATKKLSALGLKMGRLDRQKATPSVTLKDGASGKIAAVSSRLRALDGNVANTYTVNHVSTKKSSAAGNLFGPAEAKHFAAGGFGSSPDVANGHLPHLARGGTMRVFAEPETKGEAYIPLANDWRRPRARDIASATVGMLGGQVEWFAQGGFAPAYAMASSGPAASGSVSTPQSLRGLVIEGTMTTPFGPQQIRGIVREEIADNNDTSASKSRATR